MACTQTQLLTFSTEGDIKSAHFTKANLPSRFHTLRTLLEQALYQAQNIPSTLEAPSRGLPRGCFCPRGKG